MRTLRCIWLVFAKDLRIEWRSRSRLLSVVLFGVTCLILFSFATGIQDSILTELAGGLLILTLVLSSSLSLSESFRHEAEDGAIVGLGLLPVPAIAIFYGKALSNWFYLTILGPVLIPPAIVLFNVPVEPGPMGMVLAVWIATAAGLAAPGTLYSAMTTRLASQDVLLPLLLYPLITPVLMGAVRSSSLALTGDPMAQMSSWLLILLSFDVIYWSLCGLLFVRVSETGI